MTRREMVDRQLRGRGIHDERVLAAMERVPREEFVPNDLRNEAYADAALPIAFGASISQPYIVALMCQELQLAGNEVVLEIGTGSGYHAAVLGVLAAHIVSYEIVPELAEMARANLARSGYDRKVDVRVGDGASAENRYDAVSVPAGAPEVPPHLMAKLKSGGRMVIPVGSLEDQELLVITSRVVSQCRFIPLTGSSGWQS